MEILVGKVTHYYNHISVAVLELTGELKAGDTIHMLGRITDFEQWVGSMEIDHQRCNPLDGADVALAVIEYVRRRQCFQDR
jgi:hypothetical protein